MSAQIDTDLRHYKTGITRADIDATKSSIMSYARCKIGDKGITIESNAKNGISRNRLDLLKRVLHKLHRAVKLPKLDFLVDLFDASGCKVKRAPVFCISKHTDDTHVVLMPDFIKFMWASTYISDVYRGNKSFSWHSKKPQALWRGSTTGALVDHTDFERLNRSKLVALSLEHPNQLNARFSTVTRNDRRLEKILRQRGMYSDHLSMADHLKYKYILAVDGNTWASSYFWQLFGNSLILKQASPFSEWYHAALKAYTHYVPFNRDLSDLIERISWAKKNDRKVREIVRQANNFARSYLKEVDLYYYFYLALREYEKLQRF